MLGTSLAEMTTALETLSLQIKEERAKVTNFPLYVRMCLCLYSQDCAKSWLKAHLTLITYVINFTYSARGHVATCESAVQIREIFYLWPQETDIDAPQNWFKYQSTLLEYECFGMSSTFFFTTFFIPCITLPQLLRIRVASSCLARTTLWAPVS